jgi:hypothetical protein
MGDGVTDQTSTNDGNFHILLLYRPKPALPRLSGLFCALSPVSECTAHEGAARGGLNP